MTKYLENYTNDTFYIKELNNIFRIEKAYCSPCVTQIVHNAKY